jgi:hypothetical protein
VGDSSGVRVFPPHPPSAPRWTPPSPPNGRRGISAYPLTDLQLSQNGLYNPWRVAKNIIVPEANDAVTVARKLSSPGFIPAACDRVLSAVQLDHELPAWTCKIHDPSTNRVLPAKPIFARQLTQCPPQALFRLGRVSTQPTSNTRSGSQFHRSRLVAIPLRPRGAERLGEVGDSRGGAIRVCPPHPPIAMRWAPPSPPNGRRGTFKWRRFPLIGRVGRDRRRRVRRAARRYARPKAAGG